MAKKTKKTVKKAASKTIKTPYVVNIKIMGRPYSAEGSTLIEAVGNLKVTSPKGVSIMTVSKGSISREKILTPALTFRLFSPSKLMRAVSYKQISQIFNF